MEKVLVKGLKDAEPGDIVGAVAGETEVDPGKLDHIKIMNSRALVDIIEGAVEKLAEQLDGKRGG